MPRRYINPYAKYLAVDLWNQHMDIEQIKRTLRINFSRSSLHRWTHLHKSTGCVVRNPADYEPFGPRGSIPEDIQEELRVYLREHPTSYLDEIQEWLLEEHDIATCISTIDQTLRKKMNITLKKNHQVNSKQSDLKMAEYLAQVGTMPAEFMVFADESSICRRSLNRPKGRAPSGQRSYQQTKHSNAKRYSVLPGISLYGVLGIDIKENSFKRPDFESFLKHTLF
ncbi:uncharacterized protein PGTG_09982 [Puccinia graminis f. sp. tritici CRL 75-36-700-3]|uniref:Tc1-like transposase DDE domain-containing protein n=1 Tax=Puccinia graminis f. sp. tritici (strain CRL 75-36-700-3 / race SCCL) TaxID=418459 RepID=E3KEV8_PUCGT|nr:uncharacterized protein PGTG_09982 [Puccinia graminis f. sp. tritici CRL 75-36-700-3]EFP83014.2 hypothetical protein PGTG_09982 [Puccinia graminis f. sp. tritici CRL 75-36-700-3]